MVRRWVVAEEGEPAEVLRLTDGPPAEPAPGQYRVRVAAAGVGLPDVLMCRGTYPLTPPRPFTPGQEVVGEIVAAGEGTGHAVGTRVFGIADFPAGNGSFAEECLVWERSCFPADARLTDDAAATFASAFHTAWIGLAVRARLAAGEWLLVTGGAGGTGTAAVIVGKALGAHVVATARGEARAAWCLAQGADAVVDHADPDWPAAVRAATSGEGAAVVYDPVGADTFERAFDCLARLGRILPIGFAGGRWGVAPMGRIVARNQSVLGAMPTGFGRDEMLAMHETLVATLGLDGEEPSWVSANYSFDQVPDAVTAVADRTVLGRVVIHPNPGFS